MIIPLQENTLPKYCGSQGKVDKNLAVCVLRVQMLLISTRYCEVMNYQQAYYFHTEP